MHALLLMCLLAQGWCLLEHVTCVRALVRASILLLLLLLASSLTAGVR
jgi:hypothetical protein